MRWPNRARVPASRPSSDSRPGLGTEFGEACTSRAHDVTFVREGGRPFAIAALDYNDRKGVDALASVASHSNSSRSVAMAAARSPSRFAIRGEALEAVRAGDRSFVIGSAGQRYSIVLTNHTGHRFEAVGAVDGLDVINGKPGNAQTGSARNVGVIGMAFFSERGDTFTSPRARRASVTRRARFPPIPASP